MARRKIVAGNWKMNKTPSEAKALVELLAPLVKNDDVDVVYCVPAVDIVPVVEAVKGSNVAVGAENISGSTLVYLVEGALQGAPAVTAEGAEKPQIHFADPTAKTVSLAKIACHIKESDEYINDYPFLASAINGRLLYELGLVEQNKLVTDLLATSGILAWKS